MSSNASVASSSSPASSSSSSTGGGVAGTDAMHTDVAADAGGNATTAAAPPPPRTALRIHVDQWHGVAQWRWKLEDDACGICRMPFDGCCADCKLPGDDCPPVWGKCNHTFHMHCILKWIQQQNTAQQCPMCRQPWEFKE